jgi:hypothetical protein
MKNLLLSSFLAIALWSCTLGHYKRLEIIPPPSPPGESGLKPVFGDHFNSFLFKTNIHIYGKDFSGLLVTKQMRPADYRVIFTTELGMKLFDFEFADTAFTLHYCVPQFNRPALLKMIQHDIEILLMNKLDSAQVNYFTDKQHRYAIGKIRSGNFSNYYFFDNKEEGGRLVKIEHAKRQLKKTTFTLDNYLEDIPGHIRIQHYDLKLNIELTLLKK